MSKKPHEIMGVPPEYSGREIPEYTEPPDEFNRFASTAPEEERKSSRMRKIMLLLAAAGLTTLGIFWLRKPQPAPVPADAQATATAEATATFEATSEATPETTSDATPAETQAPTPTPSPTPAPTPVALTGKIHIVVYADAFSINLGTGGGYDNAVLADETFDAESFMSYTLPPLPSQEGYTAKGYVLLAESGENYLMNLYFNNDAKPHAIGSVALGDVVTAEDLGIVPLNDDGVREAEIHTVWAEDNGTFFVEFYDGDQIFDKQQVGFPLYSEGLVYLAAFRTPLHEGLIFNGWYDTTGNKVDALTYFDFYPSLPDAQSMEDRDWNNKMPCRLYASYMDPYGNVQEPSIPLPDCKPIYYQTHSVSNAVLMLTDRWHTTAVHVRIWAEQVQDAVLEYDLTESEIASGMWEETGIDLNEFYGKHMAEYEALDAFIPPVLEVTLTYRLQDGTVGTVQRSQEPKPEDYVFVSYHDDGAQPNEYTFPGCFVAEIFDTTNETPPFVTDRDRELQPGEIRVGIRLDGEWIPAENYHTERLVDTYEYEGVTYTHYAHLLVIRRPDSFPAHGTATVVIEQRFLNFDYWTTKETPFTY